LIVPVVIAGQAFMKKKSNVKQPFTKKPKKKYPFPVPIPPCSLNAPLSCPKNSISHKAAGIAAQLTRMNGLDSRSLAAPQSQGQLQQNFRKS
jgi:hypothetical protein